MEKRLIDANKIEYEKIYVYPTGNSNYKECVGKSAKIREAETVLIIPDNPTNGDMIKAMFPDFKPLQIGSEIVGHSQGSSPYFIECHFDVEWWNAPYTGLNKPDPDVGRMM